MSFGISGFSDATKMLDADVSVAWLDKTSGQPFVKDYKLNAYSQVIKLILILIYYSSINKPQFCAHIVSA